MPPPKVVRRRGRKSDIERKLQRLAWYCPPPPEEAEERSKLRKLIALQTAIAALKDADAERQALTIGQVVELLYPYSGRAEQIDCIRYLLYVRSNLVLVARTSFGKSMIMQSLPCFVADAIVIVVLPLNAIGAEQALKISALPGARPLFIHTEVLTQAMLADVRRGYYTHILISPELFVGPKLHPVVTDPQFRAHVIAIILDEVHLLSDWGQSFRTSYAELWKVRSKLPGVPWFACTATLDDKTYSVVQRMTKLSADTRVIRTSIDRPDLAITVAFIKRNQKNSFQRLYFLIAESFTDTVVNQGRSLLLGRSGGRIDQSFPSSAPRVTERTRTPQRILKTLVFFDNKAIMMRCRDTLRTWLVHYGYTKEEARCLIQVYHATIAQADKESIYAEVCKPDSSIRILLTTDALAHGADISDVLRVVQYGLFRGKSLNMIYQRFGRAARASTVRGAVYLLAEDTYSGPLPAPQSTAVELGRHVRKLGPSRLRQEMRSGEEEAEYESDASSQVSNGEGGELAELPTLDPSDGSFSLPDSVIIPQRHRRVRTNEERRADLPPVIYRLLNADGACLRRIILSNYGEVPIVADLQGPCCSNCDESLRLEDDFDECLRAERRSAPRRRQPMFDNLKRWFSTWIETTYPCVMWTPIPEYIVSDNQLDVICASAATIRCISSLREAVPDWDLDRIADISSFVAAVQQEQVAQAEAEELHKARRQSFRPTPGSSAFGVTLPSSQSLRNVHSAHTLPATPNSSARGHAAFKPAPQGNARSGYMHLATPDSSARRPPSLAPSFEPTTQPELAEAPEPRAIREPITVPSSPVMSQIGDEECSPRRSGRPRKDSFRKALAEMDRNDMNIRAGSRKGSNR